MIEYKKYRWFFTSRGTLVVGGKNAEQNDELLKKIVSAKKDYYVMHTSSPGSPFSIIVEEASKVTSRDIEESAIFTGCFSRAWRECKRKTRVDVFKINQLSKRKDLKSGTWQVRGQTRSLTIDLRLALIRQKGTLRGVPPLSAGKEKILMYVCPGKNDKEVMASAFEVDLGTVKHDELMAALPAGGVRKCS